MEAALYDPTKGYYNRSDRKRWGREGDYRTSSERSELFAATFAGYFARLYDELGRPPDWAIVEGGPGNGLFAQKLLATLSDRYPSLFAATHYYFEDRTSYGTPPKFEGIYFSNELVDAFPVHRVTDAGELYVTLDSDDRFSWMVGAFSTPRLGQFLEEHSLKLAPGQVIEVNLGIDDWLASVTAKMNRGYIVTVDYGAEARELYDPSLRPEGTLRAFSNHGFVDDVLVAPGEYDITSSVNWTQIKSTGERLGLRMVEFASQDKFLLSAGLLQELEIGLERAATDAERVTLTTDAREMILPGGMASSFQVLVQKRG